jgi:hypothetical protein
VVGELKEKSTKRLQGSDNESGDDDSLGKKNAKTSTTAMSEKHRLKDAGRKKRKLNTGGRSSLESSIRMEKIGMRGLLAAEKDEDDATTSHEKVSSNAESDMSSDENEDKKSKDKKVPCFTSSLVTIIPCRDHPLPRSSLVTDLSSLALLLLLFGN